MLRFLRKKMKTIMIVVVVLFASSMFYGLGYYGLRGAKERKDSGSLAKVNGREIDRARYVRTVNNMYSQQGKRLTPQDMIAIQTVALNDSIDFALILRAARRKVRVSRREVDRAVKQIMETNKMSDIQQLKQQLKRSGTDLPSLKRLIKDEITASKMVDKIKKEVVIGPNDFREIRASHILIQPKYIYIEDAKKRKAENEKADLESRLKAEDILKKIKEGMSFSALATLYSDDTTSKNEGGDLGYFGTGIMITEFEKTAFSLKPGEVSDVVKTRFGYHIIKLEDTRLRSVVTVEGKDISELVLAEKQENVFRKWFLELKQKAQIEINNSILNAYNLSFSGMEDEAIAVLQEAVIENPYDPYVHLFLADLYSNANKVELAIFEYNKAADLSGSNPDILISLGNAYLAAKKANIEQKKGESFTTLALEQFRKASLIAGDNKVIHEELKELFNKLGYSRDAANEEKEVRRIEKKEKFEEEIRSRATMEPTF